MRNFACKPFNPKPYASYTWENRSVISVSSPPFTFIIAQKCVTIKKFFILVLIFLKHYIRIPFGYSVVVSKNETRSYMNQKLLRIKMLNGNDNQSQLAEYLGLSPVTMSQKMTGKTQFKAEEIAKIVWKYNLTPQETYEIFFGNGVNVQCQE